MKKRRILLSIIIVLLIILTGCNKDNQNNPENPNIPGNPDIDVNNPTTLIEPKLEFFDLYNPNGIDTFTAVITNPNEVAIDVSYDIVFYKDNQEITRIENCFTENILPKSKGLIWANYNIPTNDKVDNVVLEKISVTKSYYEAIKGSVEIIIDENNRNYCNYEFECQPTIASITVVYYNDSNNNKKYDKNEIVVTEIFSVYDQKGSIELLTNGDSYYFTNIEVFYSGY